MKKMLFLVLVLIWHQSNAQKKKYDDSKDIKSCTIGGETLIYKRTPIENLKKNKAKDLIVKVETELEGYREKAMASEIATMSRTYNDFQRIGIVTKNTWNTEAYTKEYNFYTYYFEKLKEQKEKKLREQYRIEDSLRTAKLEQERMAKRIELEKKQRLEDSLRKREKLMKSNFLKVGFVNKEKLPLLNNPSPNSKTTVILNECFRLDVVEYKGEYAKVYVENVYIDGVGMVNGAMGYVLKKHLVDDLNQITVPNADKNNTTKYETKSSNVVVTGNKKFDCGPSGVKLYKGPKGGCYYLSGRSKVYVDRSCCN